MSNTKNNYRSNLSLRAATAADEEFLKAVYADSRRNELSALGWTRREEDDFFAMQFQMQKNAYRMQFPNAEYLIVESANDCVGRLIIEHRHEEIRIVDVAVLAEFRNQGIGAELIRKLKSEAEKAEKFLFLCVLKTNEAAIRFYERENFVVAEETELYSYLHWRAADKQQK